MVASLWENGYSCSAVTQESCCLQYRTGCSIFIANRMHMYIKISNGVVRRSRQRTKKKCNDSLEWKGWVVRSCSNNNGNVNTNWRWRSLPHQECWKAYGSDIHSSSSPALPAVWRCTRSDRKNMNTTRAIRNTTSRAWSKARWITLTRNRVSWSHFAKI